MTRIIGRDADIGIVRAFLTEAAHGPAELVIEGEPGIGKSALVQAALHEGAERSFAILSARPAEAEADLAFSGLGDLMADVIGTVGPALSDPQRRAVEIALMLRDDDSAAPDTAPDGTRAALRGVGLGVLATLHTLARDRPVLVAIDDVQWLDAASVAAVRFAARRSRSEPLGLLLARRAAAPAEVDHWIEAGATHRIELGPLSLGALHAVLQERSGAVLPRPVLRRIHELSRGNPLHALELAAALDAQTLHLDADARVSGGLERLLGARIDRLPVETRTALAAAAMLRDPTAALVGSTLGIDDARAALQPAVDGGVLAASVPGIRFAHPLLASAATASMSPADRRSLHRRAAAAVPDLDERARHLALAADGPDAAVADAAEAAAAAVARRGAPTAAAELLAIARRVTPLRDVDGARRRTSLEADRRFEAGDTATAASLLDGLIATLDPSPARAALLARQARVRHFGVDVAGGVALLEQALAEAAGDDALCADIEEGLAWGLLLVRRDLAGAASHARAAVAILERLGPEAALGEAIAAQALTEFVLGQGEPATISRALALEPSMRHLRVLRHPSFADGYLRACADELPEAEAIFLDLLGRAERSGDDSALPAIQNHRSIIAAMRGDLAGAIELADEASELAAQDGQLPSQASALGRRAIAGARLGRFEAARLDAERALAIACPDGHDPASPGPAIARGGEMAIWALGLVALATGDPEEADVQLGPFGRVLIEAGVREPGELRFLGDHVEALVALGRLEAARPLVTLLETMADRLGRPSTLAAAATARGLVLAAEGQIVAALADLDEAGAIHEALALPFERARVRMAAGRIRRRARSKRQARLDLVAAAETFAVLGATAWAVIALDEAARIGGPSRASNGLTAAEVRVARLVADGLSNKEVAAALVVTVKTVEATLTRLYAKLGLTSRTELVRWVLQHDPGGVAAGTM